MTSMSDVYRCQSCGYEVADIDYATMDDDDCPACGKARTAEFELRAAQSVKAEKRQTK